MFWILMGLAVLGMFSEDDSTKDAALMFWFLR